MDFKCYIILQVSKDTLCFVVWVKFQKLSPIDKNVKDKCLFAPEEINIALVYVFPLLVIPHIVLISYSAYRFNIDRMT